MNTLHNGMTPRLKPISARKSATMSVLDIGTSKVVCIVAELQPWEGVETLRRRTHLARVIGIGHHRSQGLKGGAVIDLEAAESSIRQAVHAAERMAKVEIQSVILTLSGGRLGSQHFEAEVSVRGGPVGESDLHRVLRLAGTEGVDRDRIALHALPTGFVLDQQKNIADPTGMIGEKLGVDLHVVSAQAAATRNLMLAVERCHLGVEAVVAAPYAAGLSVLADDEADMGAIVLDFGGGTTCFSVFEGGHLVHVDGFAVGGHHVTMDVARGLTTRVSAAERLKILHGSAVSSPADERDLFAVPQVDEDERDVANHLPKSHLVRIIKPRIEEILELARDRLTAVGFAPHPGRRLVLTGGASQLSGLPEQAGRILEGQVRIGRPLGIRGLPEAAKGPAFAASVGLLVYPQVAHAEFFDMRSSGFFAGTGTDGYISRVGRWLRDSF
jgi:cell division protein FtsA